MPRRMHDNKRLLFLYLDTGNGHAQPARELARQCAGKSGIEIFLRHGFAPSNKFQRFFYESLYSLSMRYLRPAYSLFYEATKPRVVLRVLAFLLARRNRAYMQELIRSLDITEIVCFHFAVTPIIVAALKALHKKLPLTVIVTDPFTAHPAWFLYGEHDFVNVRYVVFSEQMKLQAHKTYGIRSCRVFPFITAPDFFVRRVVPPDAPAYDCACTGGGGNAVIDTDAAAGIAYSADARAFKVLISGGGEGLSCAEKLVRLFIRDFMRGTRAGSVRVEKSGVRAGRVELSVVCGRNRLQKHRLDALHAKYPDFPLRIYGFVDNMSELLLEADCHISKAGASTVFEAQAAAKPLILTDYVHGQELGNVRYVVQTGRGRFIRKSSDVLAAVYDLTRGSQAGGAVADRTSGRKSRAGGIRGRIDDTVGTRIEAVGGEAADQSRPSLADFILHTACSRRSLLFPYPHTE